MDKAIITGATGMIGAALVKELVGHGVKVLAVVRKDTEKIKRLPRSEFIEIREAELCDYESAVLGEGYDVFYHFAWENVGRQFRNDPLSQYKNIKYTLDAVKLAHRSGCKKFIFAGSQAEYGRLRETASAGTPPAPESAYGAAKYAAGTLGGQLCEQLGMTHIHARIFSVYGTNDTPESMISYAVEQFLKGETASFSAGTQLWDYLYERDAGRCFRLLGENADESAVFRVANGSARPLKDYIAEMADVFGSSFGYSLASDEAPLAGISADISDLTEKTGFTPRTAFRDGIKEILDSRKGRQLL